MLTKRKAVMIAQQLLAQAQKIIQDEKDFHDWTVTAHALSRRAVVRSRLTMLTGLWIQNALEHVLKCYFFKFFCKRKCFEQHFELDFLYVNVRIIIKETKNRIWNITNIKYVKWVCIRPDLGDNFWCILLVALNRA